MSANNNNTANNFAFTQEQLDALSHIAVAGSDSAESSDSEIELDDPVDAAQQQEDRLTSFLNSPAPYAPRRQSEAASRSAMAERLRAFDVSFDGPSRRSTQ